MMLAIEISQRIGSVALRAENGTIHVEHLSRSEGRAGRHGDDLMPAIARLFARLDLPPDAMTIVAVSIGPGSFTGLRIAVSTARMFAETLSAKVIAVPSAMVAAENLAPTPTPAVIGSRKSAIESEPGDRPVAIAHCQILVALTGKRETFWATRLVREAGAWSSAGEPGLADATAFDLDQVTLVLADEYFPGEARRKCVEVGVPVQEPLFDASACLRVAERLLHASHALVGGFVDPLSLLPLYPRQPEAVTIWEQRKKK